MIESKPLKQDVDGYNSITKAIMDMVNQYPGLDRKLREHFEFCETDPEEGLSIWAAAGSVVVEDHESITGHVWEQCMYPFGVVYRASGLTEKRKIQVKDWMDTFASWLTRQPVTIGKNTYQLRAWPVLSNGREIKNIVKQSPAYIYSIDESKSEICQMDMQIRYTNEFDRF